MAIQESSGLAKGSSMANGIASAAPVAVKVISSGARAVKEIFDKQFGDLLEQCTPEGADFSTLKNIPSRIEYKMTLCEEVAKELGVPEILSNLDDILQQVSSSLFQVLFVGRYSSGKSSILNAFLGRAILPEGTAPTTKNLTWLIPGEEEYVFFEGPESGKLPLPLESLKQNDSPEAFMAAKNLFVSVSHPLLRSGVALIDTPGLIDPESNRSGITAEAIETADAIVFVMDSYVSNSEKDFLKKMVEKGRTHSIFVLINKIDTIPENEVDEFIEERTEILDQLGIAANVFPISAKYPASARSQFQQFKNSLIRFMADGLMESRSFAIEGRVDEVIDSAKDTVANMILMHRKSKAEQDQIKESLGSKIEKAKEQIRSLTEKELREVEKVRQAMLANWFMCLSTMKSELETMIDKSNVGQLKRTDLIEACIVKKTYLFLSEEIQRVTEQIDRITVSEWSDISLPLIGRNLEIGPVRSSSLSTIPPQLVTAGMLICSWPMLGLLSWLQLATVTLLGRSLLEGFFSGVSKSSEVSSMRREIKKKLNEKWPEYDGQVKAKIDEICSAFNRHIKEIGNQRISKILWQAEAILKGIGGVTTPPEVSSDRLDAISEKLQKIST